jgi:hypothetical protein
MKKAILFFLLIAGTGNLLHAQIKDFPNRSESLFDDPPPGKSNAVFYFYLPNNKRVLLEFSYISQVEQFPDLDSLVRVATAMLAPLKDSLKADGMVRRVDIVLTNAIPKIRILSHPEYSNTYTIRENELMQLKVNQDTVRILGFSKSRVQWTVRDTSGKESRLERPAPFAITLILNNVEDLTTLEPNILANCLTTLKPKVEGFYKHDGHNSRPDEYRASFYMRSGKIVSSPVGRNYNVTGEERFSPVFGFSMTGVRGSFFPSIQAGILFNKVNSYFTNSFRFYVEGQYFFSRNADNKLTIDQNSFVAFQFLQSSKKSSGNALAFEGSFSLGYLFRRTGNWYEQNTWKIGLPVLKNKHISIEPQLVFDGWFKHVSPSIKFSFNF